jgi:hypothetical protein
MASENDQNDNAGFVELYDLTKRQVVAKAPLTEIRFIPRAGERIFISVRGPRDWDSYTVMNVEYFLGYDESTNVPARSVLRGMGRVTLYVEPSK